MVTAGGNQAFLNVVLGILDPGDEVILPVPYYFNHEMAITMANARPVLAPTDSDYQLDLGALRSAITPRTRAIVTVSPNNPSGAVYPEGALRAVNALCAEHGIYHISDEAYEYFTFDDARHFSPASISGHGATPTQHFGEGRPGRRPSCVRRPVLPPAPEIATDAADLCNAPDSRTRSRGDPG